MRASPAILVASLMLLVGCGQDSGSPEGSAAAGEFDAERAFADVERIVALGPRPSGSTANLKGARLIAGALADAGLEDATIQRPWRNVVATIPGAGSGVVIVAAHHDTKDIPGFVGANDSASGVAVLLELARSLPNPMPGPAVQLVAFDAEEARGERSFEVDGTRGSRQYLEYASTGGRQQSSEVDSIRAMILFDLVGDCDLQIPREGFSDPDLYRAFAAASERLDGSPEPFRGETGAISDDHVPFVEAGIPAVDLIDFTFGGDRSPGSFWHTTDDTLDKVCPDSLDAVGEAAVEVIGEIR